jgi:two-component system, sensor histidine kinase LadS
MVFSHTRPCSNTELFNTKYSFARVLESVGHWLGGLAVGVLLGGAVPAAHAAIPAQLDASQHGLALFAAGEFQIDKTAALLPAQIAAGAQGAWKALPASGVYPLQPAQALWIRFSAAATSGPDGQRWLLEIPYAALDRAWLYTAGQNGSWTEQRAGDLTPVDKWPVPHRHPLFPLELHGAEPASFLLRIENTQGFSAPVRFVQSAQLLREEQRISLFLGVYFGLSLLGCASGLMGCLVLRDRAYAFFAMCALSAGLLQGAVTGAAALHLWPASPAWADRSQVVLALWMVVSLMLLNACLVSLKEHSRRHQHAVHGLAALGAALCVAALLTDSALRLWLALPFIALVLVVMVLFNIWAWQRGTRVAQYFLLAAIAPALAVGLVAARALHWAPFNMLTEQAMLAGMALELVALQAFLILRTQRKLINANRIHRLDRVDAETGLVNGHVFARRLLRLIARSEKLQHQSVVMLIDLVNVSRVRRNFGPEAADALPLRVSGRLLSVAREIDTAARLSERSFALLVEGPCSVEEAASLGPRIVARCLMPYQGLPLDCTAQVRVAYAMTPGQGSDATRLLARLKSRLETGAFDDRTSVFTLNEPPPSRARHAAFRLRGQAAPVE